MKFHEYTTVKQRVLNYSEDIGHGRTPATKKIRKMSPREYLNIHAKDIVQIIGDKIRTNVERMLRVVEGTEIETPINYDDSGLVVAADGLHSAFYTMTEMDWFDDNRPFYNVYPIVEKLTQNTKLDVPVERLKFPQNVMCFRFPKGHEPFGIKIAIIKLGSFDSSGAQIFKSIFDTERGTNILNNMLAVGRFDTVDGGSFMINIPTPNNATQLKDGSPVTVEKLLDVASVLLVDDYVGNYINGVIGNTDAILTTAVDKNKKPEDTHIYLKRLYFLFRLAVLVSLVAEGNDLITPAVLSSEQDKYDNETNEEAKRWLEERAAQIQGRGFNFGKDLQQRSDSSPHWRNPHMALYWTGPGGSVPVLKLRQGAIVMPKHLADVPTGFDCPIVNEETPTTKVEYVYFLRDPSQGFVKIGRTRRKIADRQKESSTFVPGGLTLLGYIETGDCVELETRIHREYGHLRRHNEFFALAAAEVTEIITKFGGVIISAEN